MSRAPRDPDQQLLDAIRASGVAGAGWLYNATPLEALQVMETLADTAGGHDLSETDFYRDAWTLTSSGAQTKTLTYLPMPYSEHVYLNGLEQTESVDWSRSDLTLSVLSPMDARTGDVLEVRYAYLPALPLPVSDPPALNVPYGSTGWKYKNNYTGDNTYAGTGYDDSAWAVGTGVLYQTGMASLDTYTAPFTDGATTLSGSQAGLGTNVGNPQAGHGYFNATNGDFWVRRWFPPGTGITLKIDSNNYMDYFIDGVYVSSRNPARKVTGNSLGTMSSPWLLAVHVTAGNGQVPAALDVEVTGTEA